MDTPAGVPLTPADDPGAGSAPSALVARQPILDAAGQVVAYELLYRGAPGTGERATARVMHAAFGDIGLENLVGARPAYINVTAKLLLDTGELPFPPSAVVLELLEDETVSPDLLERLRELADGGYVLALDDFVFRPTAGDLLELASIVKVDIRAGGLEHMRDQAALLAGHDVTMLAEKVEDQREFEACRRMGYELFQGFYFCRPVTVSGRQIPVSSLGAMQVAASLSRPDVSFEEIEEIIGSDPGLSMRLLRLLNSAAYPLRARVATVHQALTLLGPAAVRQWGMLLALADLVARCDELLPVALTRARTLQSLAPERGEDADVAFAVGLFSVADAVLGVPLAEALRGLPLVEPVAAALLEGSGPLGDLLDAVLAYERSPDAGTGSAALPGCYAAGLLWALERARAGAAT